MSQITALATRATPGLVPLALLLLLQTKKRVFRTVASVDTRPDFKADISREIGSTAKVSTYHNCEAKA